MVRNSSLQMKEHYLQKILENPSTRKWQVWKFQSPPRNVFQDGEQLRQALLTKLETFFLDTTSIKVAERSQALWSQIGVLNLKDFYLVYHPHSNYVFLTTMTRQYRDFLRHALEQVFDVEKGIKRLKLEGKDVGKLADLALNQLSQGAFSAYREYTNQFENNPLETHEVMAKRRRVVLNNENQSNFENVHNSVVKTANGDKTDVKLLHETKAREGSAKFASTAQGGSKTSGDENDKAEARITEVCVKLRSNRLSQVLAKHCESNEAPDISDELNSEFSILVTLSGKHVMNGLDAMYSSGLVLEDKELPAELHASELVTACSNASEEENEQSSDKTKKLIAQWIKTE